MQIRPFLDILPSLYEHWGTTAMQPKTAEPFREILEKVEQPTTANFLQLLTSAAEYLEPGEVICEVGCWHGANLIGVLVDRPDRLAYGVNFFSTQAEVAENKIELLQGNLETFGVAEQFCFSHQIIDDFLISKTKITRCSSCPDKILENWIIITEIKTYIICVRTIRS